MTRCVHVLPQNQTPQKPAGGIIDVSIIRKKDVFLVLAWNKPKKGDNNFFEIFVSDKKKKKKKTCPF